MEEVEIFLRLAFAGIGLILTVLTLAAGLRTKEPKVMLAAAGFGALAAEGLMLTFGIFSEDIEAFNSILVIVGLNFLAMMFLYFSVLKR